MPRKERARARARPSAVARVINAETSRHCVGGSGNYPGKCKDEITCRRQLLFPRFTRAFFALPPPFLLPLRPRIPRLFLYSPSVTNSGRKSLLEMTSRVHLLKRGSTVLFSVGILEARCIIVNTNALLRKHRRCSGTKRNERAFAEKSVLCVKQFYLSAARFLVE